MVLNVLIKIKTRVYAAPAVKGLSYFFNYFTGPEDQRIQKAETNIFVSRIYIKIHNVLNECKLSVYNNILSYRSAHCSFEKSSLALVLKSPMLLIELLPTFNPGGPIRPSVNTVC